jgi:hypothetical protein
MLDGVAPIAGRDLGIKDWTHTEFGPFWWTQTDDRLVKPSSEHLNG